LICLFSNFSDFIFVVWFKIGGRIPGDSKVCAFCGIPVPSQNADSNYHAKYHQEHEMRVKLEQELLSLKNEIQTRNQSSSIPPPVVKGNLLSFFLFLFCHVLLFLYLKLLFCYS
jgi:hypothetical protein